MTNSFRFLALLSVAACVALPIAGRAQPTYISSDTSGGTVSLTSGFDFTNPGATAIQTFTGFNSLSSMSWSLTNTVGSTQTATFNGYIAQWNGSGAVANTLTQIGSSTSLTLGANATGSLTFNASFPPLDPSLTYALIVSYASGSGVFNASYGTNPGGAFFGSGGTTSQSVNTSDLPGFQTALETGGGIAPADSSYAYAMSVTGIAASPTPAPEPKTAAAGIAAMFVAVLVGRRALQRRRLAAAPLAA